MHKTVNNQGKLPIFLVHFNSWNEANLIFPNYILIALKLQKIQDGVCLEDENEVEPSTDHDDDNVELALERSADCPDTCTYENESQETEKRICGTDGRLV